MAQAKAMLSSNIPVHLYLERDLHVTHLEKIEAKYDGYGGQSVLSV